MRDMSGQLRSQGDDLPARLTGDVADRAERLGGYLRESDAERMLGDVEDFGRRQPWLMAAACLAAASWGQAARTPPSVKGMNPRSP
jgi:hypothetical protein